MKEVKGRTMSVCVAKTKIPKIVPRTKRSPVIVGLR